MYGLNYVYYCVIFDFFIFTVNELSPEIYFNVWTTKLNQHKVF